MAILRGHIMNRLITFMGGAALAVATLLASGPAAYAQRHGGGMSGGAYHGGGGGTAAAVIAAAMVVVTAAVTAATATAIMVTDMAIPASGCTSALAAWVTGVTAVTTEIQATTVMLRDTITTITRRITVSSRITPGYGVQTQSAYPPSAPVRTRPGWRSALPPAPRSGSTITNRFSPAPSAS